MSISLQRWPALAAGSALILALVGCGSSDDGGVGSGGTGTGSFTSGTITGFGSIIVNDVRYDDSAARITDAAGNAGASADLKLGMVVEIEASDIQTDPATGRRSATASSIRYGSEIEGPVASLDAAAGQLLVLGQTVQVDAATVYDDDLRGGLAQLRVGDIVEVNGYFTGEGRYSATRIEREDDDGDGYELRGPVAELDTAGRSLRIGGATIDYSGVAAAPTLAVGSFVRVDLAPAQAADGRWVATRLGSGAVGSGVGSGDGVGGVNAGNRGEVEIEGYISALTSPTAFTVNGVPVDASGVAALPPGLAVGTRVEVEGQLVNGRLVARKVEIDQGGSRDQGLEIDGVVASHDAAARTFVVRGVTIAYDETARFEKGSAANLVAGARVEVEGRLAADGVTVQAARIEFDD